LLGSKRSKPKGNEFELLLGKQFSLWLSQGERTDLFVRNVLSGGAFSLAAAKGKQRGVPGDLFAADPIAFEFLRYFMVEGKHWKNLQFESALWNNTGELTKAIRYAEAQAQASNRHLLFAARQNYRPILLLTSTKIGECFLRTRPGLLHHLLWNKRIFACLLRNAVEVNPTRFMGLISKL